MADGQTIIITNGRDPVRIGLILLKTCIALFGVWLIVMASRVGDTGKVMIGVACVVGGAGFGLYDLIQFLDKRPKLTLSPDGLMDHRVGQEAPLPWKRIERITTLTGSGSGGYSLQLHLSGSGPGTGKAKADTWLIIGNYLAASPAELINHIRSFAPHVNVDNFMRPRGVKLGK